MDERPDMVVLVINAGSSSIKYQLYEMPQSRVLAKGSVERIGEPSSQLRQDSDGRVICEAARIDNHEQAMRMILETLTCKGGAIDNVREIKAVGHRVVHGGEEFTGSVLIDEKVIGSVEKFSDLAPLHNPANLVGIRAAMHNLPSIPQAACFDTAFHATIPETAYLYALPHELYEKHRIRRYGFHGTSHRYVARRAAQLMGAGKYDVNLITAHLGNGCSITAVRHGHSIETSMGLTPLEGLVMGTRSGDFDPAIIFYLMEKGRDVAELKNMCNKQSGLLGISGQSNDMRVLTELAEQGNKRAALAVEIFCHRAKKYIGAYAAVLDRLDAVVFTGGIGENSAEVRHRICSGLTHIGIELDCIRNASAAGSECLISSDRSPVRIYAIPTDEEAAIAADTYGIALKEIKQ